MGRRPMTSFALVRAPIRASPARWTRIPPVGFIRPREPTLVDRPPAGLFPAGRPHIDKRNEVDAKSSSRYCRETAGGGICVGCLTEGGPLGRTTSAFGVRPRD